MATNEQIFEDCRFIMKTLAGRFPAFHFEEDSASNTQYQIRVYFKRRSFVHIDFKVLRPYPYLESDIKISMKTKILSSGSPLADEYPVNTFKEAALGELVDTLEVTLEYQFAQLEKLVDQLLYAPGGPMYQEAKVDFEKRVASEI